jgi:hypothetical protein
LLAARLRPTSRDQRLLIRLRYALNINPTFRDCLFGAADQFVLLEGYLMSDDQMTNLLRIIVEQIKDIKPAQHRFERNIETLKRL